PAKSRGISAMPQRERTEDPFPPGDRGDLLRDCLLPGVDAMRTEGTLPAVQPTDTTHEESIMNDFRLLIDGRLVEGAGTLDVINPATGRTVATAPRADQAQLDQAVTAAKAAFPAWSATPLRRRAALLVELARALEAEQGRFVRLLTQEQGKPL